METYILSGTDLGSGIGGFAECIVKILDQLFVDRFFAYLYFSLPAVDERVECVLNNEHPGGVSKCTYPNSLACFVDTAFSMSFCKSELVRSFGRLLSCPHCCRIVV